MEQVHRALIRSNYMDLAEVISTNVGPLTKDLYRRGLISQTMCDNVLQKAPTETERAYALLDLIPRRGKSAFETFYTSCIAQDLFDAADILKPENAPHEKEILPAAKPKGEKKMGGDSQADVPPEENVESDEEPYPDVWPPEKPPDLLRLKVIKSVDFEEKKKKFYESQYESAVSPHGQTMNYLMKKKKRAMVRVISNEKFEHISDRDGTGKDELGLRMLFQKLDCDVKVVRELTRSGMWTHLQELSRANFQPYDCFILFILSHGHKGVVFGTDGYTSDVKDSSGKVISETPHNCLEVEKITDLFIRADLLQGKPKLFFIQACQGSHKDEGRKVNLPEAPVANVESEMSDGGSEKVENQLDFLTAEESDSHGEKLPSKADVFVAMATTQDNVSWRRPDYGTWFIQAIVEVFARYAYKKELHDLMRRVNGLIVKAKTRKGAFKQVMQKTDTFQKRFCFFPGLHVED